MILEAHELAFAYSRDPILRGITAKFEPGITALIGPNAAGKSTLLKCLAGVLRPQGNILVDGKEARELRREELSRIVSYLPQDLQAHAVLTVFETVLLGRLHELSWRVGDEDIRMVHDLLVDMGLTNLAGRYINELSGGQWQMVSIAQALARVPTILMLDEPTSNLDLRHQFEIWELIRSLTNTRKMTTVIALHDLNMAARFADRVYVLDNGAVHSSGEPHAVITTEMIATVYQVKAEVVVDEQTGLRITPLGTHSSSALKPASRTRGEVESK